MIRVRAGDFWRGERVHSLGYENEVILFMERESVHGSRKKKTKGKEIFINLHGAHYEFDEKKSGSIQFFWNTTVQWGFSKAATLG